MKIVVSKNDLKEALNLAQNVLGSSADITSHFVFEIDDKKNVSILSCEPPRLFSKVPLTGSTAEGEGQFTVDGKRLLLAVSNIADTETLTFTESSGTVKLSTAKGTLTFSSLDPSSFPSWLSQYAEAKEVKKIASELLHEGLNAVKNFISVDETRRPELCQASIKDGLLYATDSFSMCLVRNPVFADFELKVHFKDYPALLKFLKTHQGYDVTLSETDKAYFFTAEGSLLGLMKTPFTPFKIPGNYAQSFDWTPRRVWILDKQDLLQSINFLGAGADKNDFIMAFEHPEGSMTDPTLSMDSSNSNDPLVVSIKQAIPETEALDFPMKMYFDSLKAEDKKEDVAKFKFNFLYLKKAIENLGNEVVLGSSKEGNYGYMLLREKTALDTDVVSIIAWVR
jgi:DNA polymerase III sliding clamp (beta) subunit (PCNA family)